MQPALPTPYRLAAFETVDSTNEEARRRAAAGERGPLWIWARTQSAGRGRRGRTWESPRGNLMATLLLNPGVAAPEAARLSFVAALSAFDTVSALAGSHLVALKWPNDVLVDGAKIAGLLLESSGGPEGGWLAIGIGINLVAHPGDTPYPATSIAALTPAVPDAGEALALLASAWDRWFRVWQREGFAPIREAWCARAAGMGAPITARLGYRDVMGVFQGIDEQGALELLTAEGLTEKITAGEVFF